MKWDEINKYINIWGKGSIWAERRDPKGDDVFALAAALGELIDKKFEYAWIYSAVEDRSPDTIEEFIQNKLETRQNQVLDADMHRILSLALCAPNQRISSADFLNRLRETSTYSQMLRNLGGSIITEGLPGT